MIKSGFQRLQVAAFAFAILLVAAVLGWAIYAAAWAAVFDLKRVSEMPQTTTIYDRNGAILQRIYQQNRVMVSADQIPNSMKEAVIATEDQRFYHHIGVDPVSIFRAAVGNARHSHISSGASTITQQLARNSAQMTERTYGRKLKEIFLALRIERVYTKEQILTFYLNRIFFGRDIYGIEAAAQAYFGKEPKDLTLSESAMLAGIISGPNSFSPWHSPKKAKEARARSLTRMEERGYITKAQEQAALDEPLALRPLIALAGSHAAQAVEREAEELLDPDVLTKGGLKIETTIDLGFQRTAEHELEKRLEEIEADPDYHHLTRAQFLHNLGENEGRKPAYLQGAFVAIANNDGGILAMVGSRNYEESHFNRAIESARQVGSTMKPFVYANAFNTLNITAMTEVDHAPFDLHHADQPGITESVDPDYITVRQAIERSDNFAAERTAIASGVDSFAYLFQQASGVTIPPYPSSALGACAATPLQLTSAFTIFPNQGLKYEPYLIRRIIGQDGQVLYEHKPAAPKRILSPQIAFQVENLLQGVVDNGTGRALRGMGLQGDIGGKTGTTNDFKDSWFVGFTSEVTAGLWIGFDQPTQIMPGGFAARLSIPAWGRIMSQAGDHYVPGPIIPPPGVSRVEPASGIFFFMSSSATGTPEYIRDDQRDNSLAKIDSSTQAETTRRAMAVSDAPASSAPQRDVWGWVKGVYQQITRPKTDDEEDDDAGNPPDEAQAPKATPAR